MDYSQLTPEVRQFFINDYMMKAKTLRAKAANPRARKAEQFIEQAETFEKIITELKAAEIMNNESKVIKGYCPLCGGWDHDWKDVTIVEKSKYTEWEHKCKLDTITREVTVVTRIKTLLSKIPNVALIQIKGNITK